MGSRYGHVGIVECDYCGREIGVSDSDNTVEYLATSDIYLDYFQLYMLEDQIWKRIKETTGYDIYLKENGVHFTLDEIVDEICETIGLKLKNTDNHGIVTNEKIKRLPKVVNKWFALLKYLDIA